MKDRVAFYTYTMSYRRQVNNLLKEPGFTLPPPSEGNSYGRSLANGINQLWLYALNKVVLVEHASTSMAI